MVQVSLEDGGGGNPSKKLLLGLKALGRKMMNSCNVHRCILDTLLIKLT